MSEGNEPLLLAATLADQLAKVPKSTDGQREYAPCRVVLTSGSTVERVYVAARTSEFGEYSIRSKIDLAEVKAIEESRLRLPPKFATELYAAGESGMGYTVFTLTLRDGRRLPYVGGWLLDFPNWPEGVTPADVSRVEPHVGRDVFRDRAPGPTEQMAEHFWCPYSGLAGA